MRTFDPDLVNAIYKEGDTSALVNDRRNIVLVEGENIGLFAWRGPGIYEGHVHFTARGKEAIELGRKMLAEVDARMIWGLTPVEWRHVRLFNRKIGFSSLGVMETPEGLRELFILEK